MANFTPSTKSFVYGLSDFWLFFFKEIDQLETLYQGTEIQAGQIYLDLMSLLLNNSTQDAVLFNKEYFKALTIDEDDLVFRLGSTPSSNIYRYMLPDNMVDGRYLNNKILAPTASLERDVDYQTNQEQYAFDFTFDVTNAYYERVYGSAHSSFKVRSKLRGTDGGLITVQLLDDGTTPVTVSRTGYDIVVAYDGPASGNTATAATIVQALNLKEDVGALVVAEVAGLGTGEAAPVAAASAPLLKAASNPLDGFAVRKIEKTYGGLLSMNGVTDWVAEGIEKGDTLRIISGAGVGIPSEYTIRLVRQHGLYVDSEIPFLEDDTSVEYTVLRDPVVASSEGEPFSQSGVGVQSGVDGTVISASSSFQSPTLALSPVHKGEPLSFLGVNNTGIVTILDVLSPTSAVVGGIPLTDETPITWQLTSILDPVNIGADGVLTNTGDGTGTFTSATASFTTAAPGTVLRISRGGALENYLIKEYTSPTSLVLEMEPDVADAATLDWGWGRYRTPVNQVVFSPPVAWPTEGTIRVQARRAVDGRAVQEGVDYTVNTDTGRVAPVTVWAASLSNTVTYDYRLSVKNNLTPTQVGTDGTLTPGSPNVFSSPTAAFTANDVGFAIQIANSGGNNNGTHLIATVLSATSVELTEGKLISGTPDPNNGTLAWEVLERGIATSGDITQQVAQMSVWAPDAQVDQFNLYNTFGYLINKFDRSSPEYRAFIRGIFQLFMLGPTLERFESAVNTVAGLPVIRDEGEVLLGYSNNASQSGADGSFDYLSRTFTAPSALFTATDAGSYIYAVEGVNRGRLFQIDTVLSTTEVILSEGGTTGGPNEWELTSSLTQTITTTSTTYEFNRAVPLREAVTDPSNFGLLSFRAFEVLTDVFTVTDYIEDPDWWEYALIPQEIQPYASVTRRQSTPALYENIVDPADDGRVGDPGFIIGADSEGYVPPSLTIRDDAGALDGVLIPDPFQPFSTLNTYFDSPTALFTSLDIGHQVVTGGQGYRITEIVSATRVRLATFLPITAASGLAWEIVTVPLPKRNKAAFVIIDKYLKYHLFSVSFDSYFLSLLRADFFSDLQDLVFKAKPTHTYIVLQPSALFDEVILITEDLIVASALGLGGPAGMTILGNTNALLVIGSSWKIGSWFRNLSNADSFTAPLATIADALGTPDAGYTHHISKFAYTPTALLTSGVEIENADLIFRDTTDSGTLAEVTVAGNDAEITLNDVGAMVRDDMRLGYVEISGSGSGNNGVYRVGGLTPPNTLHVYASSGLTLESGLTWQFKATGSLQGSIFLDSEKQSFFQDMTATRAFTGTDVGTYVRIPFACTDQNTFRIQETTADPYVVRIAQPHQVDPNEPGTVKGVVAGGDTVVTVANPGDIVFSCSMAAEDRGDRSRLFWVVFSSGPNAGERRVIQNCIDATQARLEGAALAADADVDIHVEVEEHYTEEAMCGEWEHVLQQVQIDKGDIDLANTPAQDAGVVPYICEGVREPIDPTTAVFDNTLGDTLYAIGMSDPKANEGRSRTSRDSDLRDDPLQILRSLFAPPAGAFTSLRSEGMTTLSGEVVFLDDEGSSLSRYEAPTPAQRGTAVVVGSLTGVSLDNLNSEYYVSDTALDPTLGVLLILMFEVESLLSNDRIFDIEGFVSVRTGPVNDDGLFAMEHAGADIVSTDTAAIGDVVCLTCYWAPTGGTSRFWMNGVLQGTAAGNNAIEPTSQTFGIGARSTDGAVGWTGTFLEAHVWSDVDDISTYDLAGLHAYMSHRKELAGAASFGAFPIAQTEPDVYFPPPFSLGDKSTVQGMGTNSLVFTAPASAEPKGTSAGNLLAHLFESATSDRLASGSIDLTLGTIGYFAIRIEDEDLNGRELIRLGSFMHIEQTIGQRILVEHAGADMTTVSTFFDDEFLYLLVYWAPTGSTSSVRVNGIEEDTAAGNDAIDSPNAPIYVGSNDSAGALWDGSIIEFALWSDVDIPTLDDWTHLTAIEARAEWVRQQVTEPKTQVHVMIGQSPLDGTVDSALFASVNGVDYTVEYDENTRVAKRPATTWQKTDDSGSTTGTGPEVSFMRGLVALNEAGGDRGIRSAVYGVGGVGWADYVATEYATFKAWLDARLAQIPNGYEIASLTLLGGESDANNATDASNTQANITTIFSNFETDYASFLASDFVGAIFNLSETYQTTLTDPATVNAGIAAYVASRSNVYLIDRDVASTIGGDNLHPDAGGLVGYGRAAARAVINKANQTVIDEDDGS